MLKFLKNNFQLVNFFVAALLVGMLYGWWYLPNAKQLSINETSGIHNQEKIPSPPPLKIESFPLFRFPLRLQLISNH